MITSNIKEDEFNSIDTNTLFPAQRSTHPVKILILYGSLRKISYSRLVAEEGGRILARLGAEVKFITPLAYH